MELEKKNLTEGELENVAGGAGAAMGSYQEGDLVTVKTDQYYYFGLLKYIEVYYDGETRYVVDSAYMASCQNPFPKVWECGGSLRINPANPTTGVLIKKIYDYPEPGQHPKEYLSKWVN